MESASASASSMLCGQDDRHACCSQFTQQLPCGTSSVRVQAGGRFVEKHDRGSADQRSGKVHRLLLASGQPAVVVAA